MASYQQPQHQQTGRRLDPRQSIHSLDSSWIITELARATNENVFSDTVSSPLSSPRHSAVADFETWAEQVYSQPDPFRANLLPQLHGLPTSMIRFPTHDGRGGFTLALSTPSEREESSASRHTAIPTQSLKLSSAKALSTHASTSSSILDDALPRQAHPSTDLSQRIHAWAQEQQLYTRLRHKRRKLSMDADQRSRRHGLEGWLWRFVSRLIGIDDQLLQIVLGEKLVDSTEKSISDGTSFWESLLQHTSTENHLGSPFPHPHFQRIFRQQYEIPTSTPQATAPNNRPTRQAPSPWGETGRQRQTTAQNPGSSWSSFP